MDDIKELLEKFPFLTYIVYGGMDYIGIIQNTGDIVTTLYDYSLIKTVESKKKFLEYGDNWWWESNRIVPINVFLKAEWQEFRPCLRTLVTKDVDIKYDPKLSLKDVAASKSKRRSITLINKI